MNQFNEFAEKRAYLVKYKMVTHIATNIFWQLCPLRAAYFAAKPPPAFHPRLLRRRHIGSLQ
jgi:hypothetical protein